MMRFQVLSDSSPPPPPPSVVLQLEFTASLLRSEVTFSHSEVCLGAFVTARRGLFFGGGHLEAVEMPRGCFWPERRTSRSLSPGISSCLMEISVRSVDVFSESEMNLLVLFVVLLFKLKSSSSDEFSARVLTTFLSSSSDDIYRFKVRVGSGSKGLCSSINNVFIKTVISCSP